MATGDGGFPLSFAQEQLWFLDQLRSGETTEYLLPGMYRIRGPLDVGALETALTRVAERHEILRTRYQTVDGVATQVIDDPAPVRVRRVDLTDVPASEQDAAVRDVAADELRTPIDLHAHAPWRATLIHCAADDAVLMLVLHHIAFDGWSWGLLTKEIGAHYAAARAGAFADLPEPAVQYADYAAWQREWWDAAAETMSVRLDYWREQLAGLPPLELPTDRPRPAQWHADGASVDFTVPAGLAAAVADVAKSCGATPFMAHLAAFQLLLARFSGQSDVAVGVSVAARGQVELESLIGMFLNTVVLRTRIGGEPSFLDLLRDVKDTTLDAYDHQDVPFERVVAALAPERDASRNPVFQVGFSFRNTERHPLVLDGLDVALHPSSPESSAFDVSLHLVDSDDGSLRGHLVYPTALFDRASIERMAASFLTLLEAITADPTRSVRRLPIVPPADLEQLAAWNRTDIAVPDASLLDMFHAAAAATPDAIAVVSDAGDLTYAELAARVDALAAWLRGRGIGPETRVGVGMGRSADLVTALLGVLQAGAVYVPLPPDHPAERLGFVVADAGVAVVLTSAALRGVFERHVEVVALDEQWPEIVTAPPTERPRIDDDSAAYVIYTSGSTGRPKGVVVSHAGIRNRVLWSVARYLMTARDRVLQKTTIGFDAAVWEFLSPLVSGGTVVLAPDGAHRDPAAMARAIVEHGVTILQLVPSVLRLLLDEPELAACSTLRVVCSAGEALPSALARRLVDLLGVELVNTYGPTECSIDATARTYAPDDPADVVAIGAPLPGIRAYVVDAAGELVPIGVPGELCLAGVGLARGYLGRGDLTADRFRPNPYATTPGERWYRTGDIVRRRPDGTLDFVGRVDHQVKVGGVRVEPGEIETALLAHPDVTAAAVTAHRLDSGEAQLRAYVVPAEGRAVDADELRAHVAERLPAAMVPATVVALDALPLTANGKVDRAALPEPGATPEPAADDVVEPRTPTERAVADIMAEVLGVERVGAEHDFFALGGHSLLAIRLTMRLRRAFDVDVSVGALFDRRTVAGLAALIDEAKGGADDGIRPVPRDGALPLSFAQQRMWFLDRLEPGSTEYLIPMAFRVRGALDVTALRGAIEAVAARHEVLRTRYVAVGGEPAQVVDAPGPVDFTAIDVAGMPDAEAKARDAIDRASDRPFDLEREHPLRVTVASCAPDDHFLAITLHHIVFDAWSMGVFLRDLTAAYDALAAGRPADLTPPPVQYADFAAWQRAQESTGAIGRQLDYWRHRLGGLTPVELTTDRPRPAVRDPRGDNVRVDLPDEIGDAVAALAGRYGVTPFMVMLAAFQVLVARYTGRTDVAVGTPVAGRTRQETEDVVGFFVNNLVVRSDLAGNPEFATFLDQVRGVTLDAFANQDVPFEHLVDALRPDRDLSRNPLFQVMFELQHREPLPATLGAAALEPIFSGTPVAKFDLTLSVVQRPGLPLRCVFEYATSLFDRSTIERLAAHYAQLLASIAADPTARVGELELMPEPERATVLGAWPDPAGDRVAALDPPALHDLCVPQLVERQAARTPDAVAVVFGDRWLTYAELNARANRLAHHLRAMGVRPETVVAACLERSADAVVTLLGVLKAGGVYAPFDPQHPAERLGFMLADAGARVVVTTRRFADRLTGGEYDVVTLDGEADADAIAERPDTNPEPAAEPGNLAYVIYTSGSTGRPKGVLIEHRSYAHHCRVIADAYGITPDDRVVLLSALTFDVAMDQMAATLIAGATIVVSDPVFWTPAELPKRLAEHGVTVMEITPAYYRELMDAGAGELGALKLMNVGSDVVTVSDAQRWAATGLPGRFLCNYGPTEATVTCVLHPVAGDLAGERPEAALPIGRPVPGTRAYVVDAALRPVPLGVPGELCLGGTRLARGYHQRPALTAERFVPDPFSGIPGARLYRTGDLVRYRADGAIEFLGRIDQQVKVRGFRIELGEIEAALVAHPAVQAAAVVARDFAAGDKRLVAYVVPADAAAPPDVAALRAYLRDVVPEYMIPSYWTTLDALPLTASAKVDRKALPALDPAAADTGRAYVAPRDATEEVVAGIWADVLGLERVGAEDQFFELGGHSLLATRVLARLRDAFGVDLPLRLLFEATTVAELAAAVVEAVEAEVAALSDDEVEQLLSGEGVR